MHTRTQEGCLPSAKPAQDNCGRKVVIRDLCWMRIDCEKTRWGGKESRRQGVVGERGNPAITPLKRRSGFWLISSSLVDAFHGWRDGQEALLTETRRY